MVSVEGNVIWSRWVSTAGQWRLYKMPSNAVLPVRLCHKVQLCASPWHPLGNAKHRRGESDLPAL